MQPCQINRREGIEPGAARAYLRATGIQQPSSEGLQQPGTPIYTTDLPLDAAQQALADATPEQTASWRS